MNKLAKLEKTYTALVSILDLNSKSNLIPESVIVAVTNAMQLTSGQIEIERENARKLKFEVTKNNYRRICDILSNSISSCGMKDAHFDCFRILTDKSIESNLALEKVKNRLSEFVIKNEIEEISKCEAEIINKIGNFVICSGCAIESARGLVVYHDVEIMVTINGDTEGWAKCNCNYYLLNGKYFVFINGLSDKGAREITGLKF